MKQRPNLRRVRPFPSAFLRCRSAASPGPALQARTSGCDSLRGPRAWLLRSHAENYRARADRRIAPSKPCDATIPSRCTACACRSAASGRSAERIWARFQHLVDRYEPALVSEHLAWSTHETTYFNDLLPLPYTEATLLRVCDHIDQVQEAIRRPMLLENPSTYVTFAESTMSETDFIRSVARRTGCGLLLDVNNVFVSATNHGFSALDYLSDFRSQVSARFISPAMPNSPMTRATCC